MPDGCPFFHLIQEILLGLGLGLGLLLRLAHAL
jgi:hypothetical protein